MFAGVNAKLAKPGPRKLLSLDGGGIRGLITIEILARIESVLREQSGKRSLVLADYFDYIAGTSTGAVIGTLLALGRPVEEIRRIYLDCGQMMFDKKTIIGRLQALSSGLATAAQLGTYYARRWGLRRRARTFSSATTCGAWTRRTRSRRPSASTRSWCGTRSPRATARAEHPTSRRAWRAAAGASSSSIP